MPLSRRSPRARERSIIQHRVIRRLLPLLLLVAAAGAAAYVAWRPDGVLEGDAGATLAREAAREPEAPPPVELKGRSDARPAPDPTPVGPPAGGEAAGEPASPPQMDADHRARLVAAIQQLEKLAEPRFPGRPGRPDQSLGDPYRAPRYGRVDLLGRRVGGTGPWLPDGRGLVFTGVAHVDHEDAGEAVEEEIEEPLVTAVVGRILSGGEPVAGAEVILYSTFYQRHVRYDHHVREVGRMITDGYGVFDLRPVGLDTVHFGSNGEVLLTVHKPGYGSIVARRLDNIEPEVENDLGTFELSTQAATLVGIIRDLQGEPVEGAAVRVSGSVNPVLYDKTERMIILKDCPTSVTDAEGSYRVESFAVGEQNVSIHVNIDCTQHTDGDVRGRRAPLRHPGPGREQHQGTDRERGGRGRRRRRGLQRRQLDAVESRRDVLARQHRVGSGHAPDRPPPLRVRVRARRRARHRGPRDRARHAPAADRAGRPERGGRHGGPADHPRLALARRPSPHRFVTDSRYWHAADGRYDVVVPEGAIGATVGAAGRAPTVLEAAALADGRATEVALPPAE